MKLDFAKLCDYAAIDAAGKLNLIGVFTRFNFAELPVIYHRFYIVMMFNAEKADHGASPKLRVRLLDPNGAPTLIDQEVDMEGVPEPTMDEGIIQANMIFEVNGMKFSQYGMHQLVFDVDGKRAGKVPIGVRKPGEGLQPEQPRGVTT